MSKGFGNRKSQRDPIADAAGLLYGVSSKKGQPLIVPMYPPGNDRGLEPGQTKPGLSELAPTCDGLVIAVRCSADDAQTLFDLVFRWESERRRGGDQA